MVRDSDDTKVCTSSSLDGGHGRLQSALELLQYEGQMRPDLWLRGVDRESTMLQPLQLRRLLVVFIACMSSSQFEAASKRNSVGAAHSIVSVARVLSTSILLSI